MDSKIVQVALSGLENILRLGQQEASKSRAGPNPYAILIEECYGLCLVNVIQLCFIDLYLNRTKYEFELKIRIG